MHKRLKYLAIIILVLSFSGCSIFRKARESNPSAGTLNGNYSEMAEYVMDYNITDNGFEIKRGSITLEGTELEGTFGLHARLNSKGDFYASVRGPLGIELARILLVGNDIAAIDRFNRKIYIGSKASVLNKNGLPEDFMKILFGDMTGLNNDDFSIEGKNEILFTAGDDRFKREITICTDEMKICREKIDAKESGHSVYMAFSGFRIAGDRKYASEISIEERKRMFHVKLYIDDLLYGYDNEIEFNLPSYERESF